MFRDSNLRMEYGAEWHSNIRGQAETLLKLLEEEGVRKGTRSTRDGHCAFPSWELPAGLGGASASHPDEALVQL